MMLLWTLMAIWLGCGGESHPCERLDAAACTAAAEAAWADESSSGREAMARADDACKRLEHKEACRFAGDTWLSGKVTSRYADHHIELEGSPFGKGIAYLDTACELGDGEACWNLARRYLKGIGLPVSEVTAATSFARGCSHDHSESCVDRGIFFETGRGGDKDGAQAAALYAKACELKDGRGCTKLGMSLRDGLAGEVDGKAGLARIEEGCHLGFIPGCGIAAMFWDQGGPVTPNLSRRIDMLVEGAVLADPLAFQNLNELRDQGKLPDDRLREVRDRVASECGQHEGVACLIRTEAAVLLGDTDISQRAEGWREGCRYGADRACGLLYRLIVAGEVGYQEGDEKLLMPERGCSSGMADVCMLAGKRSEQGVHDEPDLPAAQRSYSRACGLGDQEGCEAQARVEAALNALP